MHDLLTKFLDSNPSGWTKEQSDESGDMSVLGNIAIEISKLEQEERTLSAKKKYIEAARASYKAATLLFKELLRFKEANKINLTDSQEEIKRKQANNQNADNLFFNTFLNLLRITDINYHKNITDAEDTKIENVILYFNNLIEMSVIFWTVEAKGIFDMALDRLPVVIFNLKLAYTNDQLSQLIDRIVFDIERKYDTALPELLKARIYESIQEPSKDLDTNIHTDKRPSKIKIKKD